MILISGRWGSDIPGLIQVGRGRLQQKPRSDLSRARVPVCYLGSALPAASRSGRCAESAGLRWRSIRLHWADREGGMFEGMSEAPAEGVEVRRWAPDARHTPPALQCMTPAWEPRRCRKRTRRNALATDDWRGELVKRDHQVPRPRTLKGSLPRRVEAGGNTSASRRYEWLGHHAHEHSEGEHCDVA